MTRRIVVYIVGIACFCGMHLLAASPWVPRVEVKLRPKPSAHTDGPKTLRDGPELAFVYIGSASCAFSNIRTLPTTVIDLKRRVQAAAKAHGRGAVLIGIARDHDVEAGLAHLEKFGRFDEVVSGRSTLNLGMVKYVHQEFPGQPVTPQLVVTDRVVAHGASGIGIRSERVLTRKVGYREIEEWLANGVNLPGLADEQK